MALKFDGPPGATPLEPEELDGLIPAHISERRELDEWESRNILKAEQWLQGRSRTGILTVAFVKQLHKRMFGETWKWAGTFRDTEKNIGIDPIHIPVRTRDLYTAGARSR